jgi:hypothetical protein
MTRVFIGSTSKDLADYRQMAIEVCLRSGTTPVAMEYFEAGARNAAELCRRKIDDSDLYVGIVAHRYGHIDPEAGRSITEIEFDHAGKRRLDRLCFLVDRSYPWPVDAIDQQHHERLAAFRARIDRTLVRGEFTTVDNFGLLLFQALEAWRTSSGTVAGSVDPVPEVPVSLLPPPPPLFVGRADDVHAVKARLFRQQRARVVLRGWPGVGKTTTVLSLARDPEIEARFPDGVLWASLGQNPESAAELGTWARSLGVPFRPDAPLAATVAELRAALHGRQALLIVDDVWSSEAAAVFDVAGPQCATLYTTRLPAVARELAPEPSDVYVLGQLSDEDAFDLLARLAPVTVADHHDRLAQLIADLEGLPLALRVAARLLEAESSMGWGIDDLLDALAADRRLLAERAPEDRFDPRTGTLPTVDALFRQSTDMLDPEARDRFAFLGVFAPKPATFDLPAMQAIWMVDDPRPTARTLADRGLLEPLIGTGRFQLHAVLKDHAASLLT